MPRTRIIAFLSLAFSLFSCSSTDQPQEKTKPPSEQKPPQPALRLSGQVYYFAPDFDTTTCEASAQSDCMSSHLLFINEKKFVEIGYCESTTSFFKGTYLTEDSRIVMNYDSLSVDKEYNFEADANTTQTVKPEYIITANHSETEQSRLTHFTCKNIICFKSEEKAIQYGTPDNKEQLDKYLTDLKTEGIWQKLEMK